MTVLAYRPKATALFIYIKTSVIKGVNSVDTWGRVLLNILLGVGLHRGQLKIWE